MLKVLFVDIMVFRRAFSYLSYSFLGSIVGIFTLMYMTRLMGPEELGVIGLFSMFIFFLVPAIGFKAENLVPINKSALSDLEYLQFRNAYISLIFVLFILIYVISLIFVFRFYKSYFFFSVLVIPIAFFQCLSRVHGLELVQGGRSTLFGQLQLSTGICALVSTVFLVSSAGAGWEARLAAILFAEFLFCWYRFYVSSNIAKSYRFSFNDVEIFKIIKYGAPLFLVLTISWVVFESDKIIVAKFFSLSDLGLYTVAYSVGAFFNRINEAVSQAVLPKLYSKLKDNKGRKLVTRYSFYYGVFVLLLAAFSSLIFYDFSGLVFGEVYESSRIVTCIVLFAYAFFGISRTRGIVINYYKLNILKVRIMFVAAVANLTFSLSMLPYLGLQAPAYGTLVSFVVMAALFYRASNKEMEKRGVAN